MFVQSSLNILGLEGQSLKYSVNMVLTCIIYCALLQVHGHCIYLCRLHIFRRRETKVGNPLVFASHVRDCCSSITKKLYVFETLTYISLIELLSLELDV